MKYTRTDLDFVYKVIAHPTRPFFRATAVIRFHNSCNLCNPCNFYNFEKIDHSITYFIVLYGLSCTKRQFSKSKRVYSPRNKTFLRRHDSGSTLVFRKNRKR